jgi:hypothetical protein
VAPNRDERPVRRPVTVSPGSAVRAVLRSRRRARVPDRHPSRPARKPRPPIGVAAYMLIGHAESGWPGPSHPGPTGANGASVVRRYREASGASRPTAERFRFDGRKLSSLESANSQVRRPRETSSCARLLSVVQ